MKRPIKTKTITINLIGNSMKVEFAGKMNALEILGMLDLAKQQVIDAHKNSKP